MSTTEIHRIAWLSVNASHSHSSFALPCIHAAARNRTESQWCEIAATTGDTEWGILKRLLDSAPDMVCTTLYLFNRNLVMAVLERFAALTPGCQIVLGGPEFLGDNREFLKNHPFVNALFRGESEIVFTELLRHRDTPEKWRRIAGLCHLDDQGGYHDNGLAVTPAPLDQLPSPLTSSFYDTAKPFASIETSRGCPSRCDFCTSGCLGVPRYFSLDRVDDDLNRLRHAHVREVRVLDRTFNFPTARCVKLLALMADFADSMRFHIEVNPAALTPATLRALHDFPRGALHIEAGLQTGNPGALKAVARYGPPEHAWNGLRKLCEIPGLDVHVDLIAGLPQVSLDDIHADLQALGRLGPAEIQLEILKLLPGTPLRDAADREQLVFVPRVPYEVLRTPAMPFKDLNEVRLLSKAVDLFYNDSALQPAVKAAVAVDPDFFKWVSHLPVDDRHEPVQVSRKNRFRLLHTACRHIPEARALLEYAWMAEGQSASHGLVNSDLWKTDIPTAATLVEGDPNAVRRRHRIWHCRIAAHEYWFVYTRERQQKQAASIFKI